jgi:hypothetical protein
LNNILSRIAGKTWKIPVLPQFKSEIALIADLFKAEAPTQEDNSLEQEDN